MRDEVIKESINDFRKRLREARTLTQPKEGKKLRELRWTLKMSLCFQSASESISTIGQLSVAASHTFILSKNADVIPR